MVTSFSENKNANNKVDVMYKIWLGRWFVVQTDNELDMEEFNQIRTLLNEASLGTGIIQIKYEEN